MTTERVPTSGPPVHRLVLLLTAVCQPLTTHAGGFMDARALGNLHPHCGTTMYNPNMRLLSAMAMLLFPILFYAVYQCCSEENGACSCQRWRDKRKTGPAMEDEVDPTMTTTGAESTFQSTSLSDPTSKSTR